jgi:WD40 repeat protein
LDHRLFLLPLNDVFPERLGIHSGPLDSSQREFVANDETEAHLYRITDISFSPDGNLVASSDSQGFIKLWSLESRNCVAMIAHHTDAISSISFSPRGDLLASASYDEFIHIWKLNETGIPTRLPVEHSRRNHGSEGEHDLHMTKSRSFQ